jgi:hypothetical protein
MIEEIIYFEKIILKFNYNDLTIKFSVEKI